MTALEINIAIAEVLGFANVRQVRLNNISRTSSGILGELNGKITSVPNFYESLDACAEFEEIIDPGMIENYVGWLIVICEAGHSHLATAPQRCEAFLTYMSLWKDDKS